MASRKSSRGAGGSPSPGSKRETKHGGSKNGKKEGLSGSSFFTWFMVIALLGVWTSVAVVWFELVDYEEVLAKAKDFRYNLSEVLQGKLGIYDADGDGDFDVEDAKVLLGLKERSVPAQPTPPESEETVQAAETSYVESEHKTADVELEDESQSVLHETLHSQPGERHEDVDESISDQWQVKEEIHGETFEAPTTDDMHRELENAMPEAYETPDSIQKDADLLADDLEAVESEPYEVPASDDYVASMEERVTEPEAPGDSEVVLEDAMEHYTEDIMHDNYNEDQEPKHEKQAETQDTAVHDLPEELNEATEPDKITEDFDIAKDVSESKKTEDNVAIEPKESEIPVQAEDYSNDVRVDT
ncbi:aspartyl/asparaginyl beta-hydroxylase-like isoform X2 [Myiozetetes cayanensis]|uniref:aspartyl/asparaginyl beta-hydroxylase-like isoform X2 n=1 Tax=Myiozetetes cayanensis TaxID=478635 RepID=UPI00215EA38F|nr:aspartyl/asparaginyl beta-hydroxylase-like isoform X2 [Myiozetetes cayanensis]